MFRKLDGAVKADTEDTKLDVLFYRMPRSEGITKKSIIVSSEGKVPAEEMLT